MSARMTVLITSAALLAGTAFAAAQSDAYQNGRDQMSRNVQQNGRSQLSRNAAPNAAARRDAYNGQLGWRSPASGYYDFAGPGNYYAGATGGYYDQAYWRGAHDIVPGFPSYLDPYAGTYFNNVAPW